MSYQGRTGQGKAKQGRKRLIRRGVYTETAIDDYGVFVDIFESRKRLEEGQVGPLTYRGAILLIRHDDCVTEERRGEGRRHCWIDFNHDFLPQNRSH
jgi:hypothetical protein